MSKRQPENTAGRAIFFYINSSMPVQQIIALDPAEKKVKRLPVRVKDRNVLWLWGIRENRQNIKARWLICLTAWKITGLNLWTARDHHCGGPVKLKRFLLQWGFFAGVCRCHLDLQPIHLCLYTSCIPFILQACHNLLTVSNMSGLKA